MKNKFKASNGIWLTKALFFETSLLGETRHHALFTLKDEDHVVNGKVYKSLRKLFLDCEDPTEYEFATTHLGGWKHWGVIQGTKDLIPYIEDWREEYTVKLRSTGIKKIIEKAKEPDGYQAAKYLSDKGWIDKTVRGRPSKQEIAKNTKEQSEVKKRMAGDIAKLNDFRKTK